VRSKGAVFLKNRLESGYDFKKYGDYKSVDLQLNYKENFY
jgi:hypothetical protein